MHFPFLLLVVAPALAVELLTDISTISRYWGQLSNYADNPEHYFGIDYVGLPDGCQVVSSLNRQLPPANFQESAQTLQRHAQRFPTSAFDDGANDQNFATKLSTFQSNSTASFTGPLSFLNGYQYAITDTGLLTGIGAVTEISSGVSFWNR